MNLKSRARGKKKEDIEWDLSQTFTQFKNACDIRVVDYEGDSGEMNMRIKENK